MWFGTEQGVTCFDTKWGIWKNYQVENGLPNDFVYQVFEDKQGKIWIATNGGGISRYSGNAWTSYTVKDGLSHNIVRAITQSPNETLWFGTYGKGICSWRPETGFEKIDIPSLNTSYVLSMLAVSDSMLLIGTLNQGLIILKDTIVSFINDIHNLSGNTVFSLYSDHTGKVWIGNNNGSQQLDLITLTVSPCPDSLKGKAVYSVTENNTHDIVFASSERIYQYSNGIWSSFIPDNLGQPTDFYSVFFDSEDRGWFGSASQGMFMNNDTEWYHYYYSTGLEEYSFNGICEDKENKIWACSRDDIYCFDGQNWRSMAKSKGLDNQYFVELITDIDGNIWCRSRVRGIFKYNDSNWTTYSRNEHFNRSYLTCISPDKYGNIWVGTERQGLYKYDGNNWIHLTTTDGLASNKIDAMAIYPDGRILVTSDYGELSIFDSLTWKVINYIPSGSNISDMIIDEKNRIWLATNYSVVKIENGITSQYLTDGGYGPRHLSIDNEGHLWAGSRNGLYRFDGKNWYEYNTSNALIGLYINDVFFDTNERIWLATSMGINMSDHLTYNNKLITDRSESIDIHPNPCSDSFDLIFHSDISGMAQIILFSLDGKFQKQFSSLNIEPGTNEFHFKTTGWPDGLFIYELIFSGKIHTGKLLKIQHN
jgi:streptogramin lyase